MKKVVVKDEVKVRKRWAEEGKEDLVFHDVSFNPKHFGEIFKRYSNFFRGKILDLGAGCCWFSSIIKSYKPDVEVISCDVSPEMMKFDEEAAKRMGVKYFPSDKKVVFDGKKLPFRDGEFDCVFASAVLHHIPNLLPFLKETKRVIKKGGVFIAINEPCSPALPPNTQIYEYLFGRETKNEGLWERPRTNYGYKKALESAGFASARIEYDKTKIKRNFEKIIPFFVWVYNIISDIPGISNLNRYFIGGSVIVMGGV